MKKYKFITIEKEENEEHEGRPVYYICSNKDIRKALKERLPRSLPIGLLVYYKLWKQYVFSSHEGAIFNNSCLHDIIDFIENEIPPHGGS